MPLVNIEMDDRVGLTNLAQACTCARRAGNARRAIVVMVHGFRYCPNHPTHRASRTLFAPHPAHAPSRVISWPRHLGALDNHSDAPLCVGFGWPARATLWEVQARTQVAGRALAAAVSRLSDAARQPVDLLCHSMGVTTSLAAFAHLNTGRVARLIALSGAAFLDDARAAMDTEAGQATQMLNVISAANAPFDRLLELSSRRGGRALGAGLTDPTPGWTDLHIDAPDTLQALQRLGYPVARPGRAVCHWSSYLRPGLFALYRGILTGQLGMGRLRTALPHHSGANSAPIRSIAAATFPRFTTNAVAPLSGQTMARAYQRVFDPSCDRVPSGPTAQPNA